MTSKRKVLFSLTLLAVLGLAYVPAAQAGHGYSPRGSGYSQGRSSYSYRSYGYRRPVYHAPSVHLDRVFHADTLHWTPGRGLHVDGHYDLVPHYTPGHFDTLHNGHIDLNRRHH